MAKIKMDVVYGTPLISVTGAGYTASQVFNKLSGRYVVLSVSDSYWDIVANGEAVVGGYTKWTGTVGTTDGEKIQTFLDVDKFVTELPYSYDGADAALTQTVLDGLYNKLVDIYVTANIQYADNRGTVADSVLRCMGGNADDDTLYCICQTGKMGTKA